MEAIDIYIPDFTNYLLNKIPINFNNYFLLIKEENTLISANPFLCLLISFYLKNNINVILAGVQESLNHYTTILKKMVKINIKNNIIIYYFLLNL